MARPIDRRRYVILGNSVAGVAAAQEIRRHDPVGEITILSDERGLAYSRPMLPLYIAGKRAMRDLAIVPGDFYRSQHIRLLPGQAADGVDAGGRTVLTASGARIPFDALLVATGSSPRVLEVPGAGLPGVCALRSLRDARGIRDVLHASRDPVVIAGGGLVGMKSLEALVGAKREVHLVVSSDRVLSQMLDRPGSEFFLAAFRRHGVTVHLRADVSAFLGRKRVERVRLADGSELACGLAIVGKGVRPNVGCLQGTGVALNEGVRVDDRMATSLPSVFAAGDVAEPPDVLQGRNLPSAIWPSAGEGGRIAGSNMAGAAATFSGAIRMNAVEILGVRAISAGDREGGEALTSLRPGAYRTLVVADGRLRGYLLVGDIRGAGVLTALVKNRTEVAPAVLARDLDRGFSYRPRLYALGGSVESQVWGGTAR